MSFARNGICERESQLTGHGCLLDASLVLDVMNCLLLLMEGIFLPLGSPYQVTSSCSYFDFFLYWSRFG